MTGAELIGGKTHYASDTIFQWLMLSTEIFSHFIFKYEITATSKSH